MRCRLCDSTRLVSVMDLGCTPPCEKFVLADELDADEQTLPLHLRLCEECLLLQIPDLIRPGDTFIDYAYYSSYSDSWVEHARAFVETTSTMLGLNRNSFVVEVASNDGYLLQHVVAAGIPCLGIEPSINVGAVARSRGVPSVMAFLDEQLARAVRDEFGAADLVIANNVYAHIPDLLGFTRALRILLGDNGWLSIEVHHAFNLITLGQFDTIYHEHFQYYTVLSAMLALGTAGCKVVDVEQLGTHGGSIRLWVRPEEVAGPQTARVTEILRLEEAAGLHEVDGYLQLRPRAEAARRDLLTFLRRYRDEGKRVVGYGAPGKGNTLLNFCGITSDLLEYTVDRNPYKHGRFTPGTRIPIYPPARLEEDRPDVVLALPWNLERELTEQLAYVAEWGGRLFYPLPTLHEADLSDARVKECR